MMSLEEIRRASAKAARTAAARKRKPYSPFDADEILGYGENPIPFPFLGDYVPGGWRLQETWFVDASGCGLPSEPALTMAEFKKKLLRNLGKNPGCGYAIVEKGQFQVYVGVFERTLKLVK